jgi:S-adenosylmethionine hydrolase
VWRYACSAPAERGPAVEPSTLAELKIPEPTVQRGKIECEVLDLNRFGNVLLNVRESQLTESGLGEEAAIQVDATSGSGTARYVSTYSDVESGDWGIIVDPRGWLLVIRGNPANAAEGLGSVSPGDPIWLTAART